MLLSKRQSPKTRALRLRPGTSYEEIWACAAAAYCYLTRQSHEHVGRSNSSRTNKTRYEEFRRGHLPRGVRPEPDLLLGESMVFQYDGQYFHADRADSDAETNRKHAKQGFRVMRLRDRLPPLPGCENIISLSSNIKAVQRDIFDHFQMTEHHTPEARETVAHWAMRRIEELTRCADGRGPGIAWIRSLSGQSGFDERWRLVQFEDPGVFAAHRRLRSAVGDRAYLAAMRTSLYQSAHLKPLMREIRWWVDRVGPRSFSTLMGRKGIAGGLEREAFRTRMREWARVLGSEHFTAWACNSVASRLEDPAFNRSMRRWLRDLGPEYLSKWMCDGVASRIVCPQFNRRAREWLRRLRHKFGERGAHCFAVWMNNCVARRLCDARFDRIAREWLDMVDSAPHYVTIFHGCFVNRLQSPNFDTLARSMMREMGSAQFIVFLNRNRGRKLDRVFPLPRPSPHLPCRESGKKLSPPLTLSR